MISLTFHSLIRGWLRPTLLALGLLTISAGVLLVAAASQTTALVADRELQNYWRTTYDILVRPAGVRSPIEEKYGLVEANSLSGIWGGITFQEYETIKSIPGVEVAAPIAMIGYIPGVATSDPINYPSDPGLYLLEQTVTVSDGSHFYTPPDFPNRDYYYFDRNPQKPPSTPDLSYYQTQNINVDDPSTAVSGGFTFPLLIAGIDPLQESALIGLDRTVIAGSYLQENESLAPTVTIEFPLAKPVINLPILVNVANYLNLTDKTVLKRVLLPSDVVNIDQILARGGTGYLIDLPTQIIADLTTDNRKIYQKMFEAIAPQLVGVSAPLGPEMLIGTGAMLSSPGPIVYEETQDRPNSYAGIVLELVPPSNSTESSWPQYRATLGSTEFQDLFMWDPKGIIDIERLPKPADVNRVPMETYFPPIVILRYDDLGHPINPPQELHPTLNLGGYIQSPPLVLTTLDAARAMRGETAISAIRVRVALADCPTLQSEVCRITPAAERKIEAVAMEIRRRTGLEMDIMAGSSPRRILVHIPGIGYAEEQWIQKGVNLIYKQDIQAGNWLLLGTLLATGALFTLDMTWAEGISQQRWIALQKALGWHTRTVFVQFLGRTMVIAAISVCAGTASAWIITRVLNWQVLPASLLLGLPLVVFLLTGLASLPPVWRASHVPPMLLIQQAGLRHPRRRSLPASTLVSYAWNDLMRRPARTLLTAIASALTAALLVILLAVAFEQRGLLSGTLLGEFVLVHIERFHYAIVAIGFGLAGLSTVNGLMGSVIERRREIGVLKAVGWRTGSVVDLFVLEGIILGFAGGVVGALLGSGIFLYLYQSLSLTLVVFALVGTAVAGLVGGLAGLYPGRVAARVLPAEAVHDE